MRVEQHIRELRSSGELMAKAAEQAGFDAEIPTCPGWRMRDLLRHTGGVHRWAAAHVREARSRPVEEGDLEKFTGGWPPDAELAGWFRSGAAALAAVLEEAPDDLECWAFLPAPSPRAFWARRQAHETAMHRVDAESALGGDTVPVEAEFAADGLDELLLGFAARPGGGVVTPAERTLLLEATDLRARWLVRLTAGGGEGGRGDVVVSKEPGEAGAAECVVRGAAAELYPLMWNRRAPEGLDLGGDAGVLALWREQVRIRWRR